MDEDCFIFQRAADGSSVDAHFCNGHCRTFIAGPRLNADHIAHMKASGGQHGKTAVACADDFPAKLTGGAQRVELDQIFPGLFRIEAERPLSAAGLGEQFLGFRQCLFELRRILCRIHGKTVGGDHISHIVRPAQTPLDLQGTHSACHDLGNQFQRAEVL